MKKVLLVTLLSVMGLSFAHADRGDFRAESVAKTPIVITPEPEGGVIPIVGAPAESDARMADLGAARPSVYIDQLTGVIYVTTADQQVIGINVADARVPVASLIPAFCFGSGANTPYCRSILGALGGGPVR